jgi:DNA processing protein
MAALESLAEPPGEHESLAGSPAEHESFVGCEGLAHAAADAAAEAEQRRTCLWLAELASVRPGVVQRLCTRFDGLPGVIEQPRERLAEELQRGRRRARAQDTAGGEQDEDLAEAAAYEALLAAAAQGPRGRGPGTAITYVDAVYPEHLRRLHDPPPALYVHGAGLPESLQAFGAGPVVGVVGTRGPSAYGREMATAIATDLARAGVVVVSGLAMGIDAVAQQAALRAARHARPATVGVLGCGIDVVYPRCNARLFAGVLARGLLISEFVWGLRARAWRFPARNRVIAGLCDALVVVEGAERSGALITADFMNELNGNVLAVPGEAGRRLSAGPHKILREQYGHLCESAADVFDLLGISPADRLLGPSVEALGAGAGAGADRALALLEAGECTADELAAAAGVPVAAAAGLLSRLELEGLVQLAAGGRYRLVRGRPSGRA